MNPDEARSTVEEIYRLQSRRVYATLVRLLGDFDLAEEAVHEAFRAALEQWSRDGLPANPAAWLISAGRFKGIDALRRRPHTAAIDETALQAAAPAAEPSEEIEDDRLRLIFTCC